MSCGDSIAFLCFSVKWNNGMERLKTRGEEKEKPLWFSGRKVEWGMISRAKADIASSYATNYKGSDPTLAWRQRTVPVWTPLSLTCLHTVGAGINGDTRGKCQRLRSKGSSSRGSGMYRRRTQAWLCPPSAQWPQKNRPTSLGQSLRHTWDVIAPQKFNRKESATLQVVMPIV